MNLIVVPLYNEEAVVVDALQSIRTHSSDPIVLIDDGSVDSSIERIRAANIDQLAIIQHATNQGYGAALTSGFSYFLEHSQYDTMVTMDCDGQHDPSFLRPIIEGLKNCDIVSGSRYLREFRNNTDAPVQRREINGILTELINRLWKWNLTDSFCGYKGYRRSAVELLKPDETGYAYPMQAWVQIYANHLKVKELAVARIYLDMNRSFGAELDKSIRRLKYYLDVFDRELGRQSLGADYDRHEILARLAIK